MNKMAGDDRRVVGLGCGILHRRGLGMCRFFIVEVFKVCHNVTLGFCPGQRPARMFVCRKAWTSVSVAARRTEERVSVRQESVRINAFKKNVCRPTHIARDRASAERSAWQSYTFICIWQIVSSRHVVSVLGWVML